MEHNLNCNIAMVGFKFRNYVRLQGLSTTYNGKLARILSSGADEITGRFLVELQVGEEVLSNLSREMLVKPANMVRACDGCRHAGAATMQYCGSCKNAAYCNAECQRSDWKRHKGDCSHMNAQRRIIKRPLLLAALQGNLAEVQKLVREGADVNQASMEDCIFPLYVAAEMGHLSVVQYLVEQGAEKDKALDNGKTAIFIAAQLGHLAMVQYLIQQGADMDKATNEGGTPLVMAAQNGDLSVVQCLVQLGADKDKANNNGATPLFTAVQQDHLAVVRYLVQQGADKNKAVDDGTTPLSAAIANGHTAVANYLREQGAN